MNRLAAALAAVLVATVVLPMAALLATGGSPSQWLSVLGSAESLRALTGTLLTSFGASAIALGLGLPLAWMIGRSDIAGRGALRAIVALPSAIPPYLWAMGWIALANPKSGWLTLLFGQGTIDIYGTGGIAFVLGTSALPLVALSTLAALSRIDPSLEEAARLCGASTFGTFRTVTLPLIAPAALSGAALVFVFASASFGVPYLLGVSATPPSPTLTTRIYSEVLMGGAGLSTAAVTSIELLMIAAIVLFANAALARAGRVRIPRGKGVAQRVTSLGAWRLPASALTWFVVASVVVLPLAAVFLTGVQPSWGQLGFTLKHWGVVLAPRTLEAAGVSVLLATAAALLVGALGLAVAATRKRWLETLADVPSAIPGTVLALALLVAFSRDIRFVALDRIAFVLALGNTVWIVLLALVVKHLALGVRSASDSLSQADPSLAEAARLSGAGRLRAFWDGIVPQLRSALVSAMVLTFLTCVSELTMSVLLVPTGRDVLGTLLFELQSYADPAAAAAIASALLVIVFAALVLQQLLARTKEAR